MQPLSSVTIPSEWQTESREFDRSIEQTVARYFATLNQEEFQATVALFAPEGVLQPPMESAIVGREAIVAYLETEAKGMHLLPQDQSIDRLDTGEIECKVTGKVQTPLFGVNVAWQFIFTPEGEIQSVKVKLLAALEELLNLRF